MIQEKEYLSLKNGTDIRGNAMDAESGPAVLTQERVVRIAAAFCQWLLSRTGKTRLCIAVGHDSRLTAEALSDWVTEGIAGAGCDVLLTGLSSTPSMFMLLQENFGADASVMITASHLPKEKNGLKFFLKEGGLEGKDVGEILSLAAERRFSSSPRGEVKSLDYLPRYAERLVKLVREKTGEERPLAGKRIVVDAGNGAGGFYAEKVLIPLGADTEGSQFLDADGNFPNHIPNPENAEAMRSVCEAVKRAHADFGIIFDTDVDRAGAVGGDGEEINRNRLIALISAVLLRERAGGTIVTDSVTSDGLSAFLNAHGGVHRRFKRGYKNVIDESIRLNRAGVDSPLAIETSGHAALKENYFLDDGAYLVTRLLIALAEESKKGGELTDLIKDLPEPKEAAEVRPKIKGENFGELGQKVLHDFENYCRERSLPLAPENFEGVRVNFPKGKGNGWLLIRMSLHEPILPVNAESESEGGVETMLVELYEFLKRYDFLDLSPILTKLGRKAERR